MKQFGPVLKTGEIREGRPRTLTLSRALALSGGPLDKPGWPDKNLHTDAQAAADAGLPAIVVSGTQWEGYAVGLLVETFGPAWFEGGIIDIKIPRSVRIGETIRPRLRLEEITGAGNQQRARVKIWCENGQGQEVLVGTASCAVPGPGAGAVP